MSDATAKSESRPSRPGVSATLLVVLVIVGVQVAAALLVSPARDYPIGDDWAYAQIVQSILQGHLRMSDFVGPSIVFHAYWGALWCWLFGFSFTVLTVANMAMNVFAGLALYGLLRELQLRRSYALLGALVLMLNPLSLYLSYTFKSDITFLALECAALWTFVAAWRRPHSLWLMFLGGVLSAAAVLTRQIGFVIPLVAAAMWLFKHRDRDGVLASFLAVFPSVLGYASLLLWVNANGGPPWAWSQYSTSYIVDYVINSAFPRTITLLLLREAGMAAFLLLPICLLLIPVAYRWGRASGLSLRDLRTRSAGDRSLRNGFWVLCIAGLTLLLAYSWLYSRVQVTFNQGADELGIGGYAVALSAYDAKVPVFPLAFWRAMTMLVLLLVILLWLFLGVSALAWLRKRFSGEPESLLVAFVTIGLLALTLSSPYFYDRYLLPLSVGLIALLLMAIQRYRLQIWPALLGLLLCVFVGLTGVADLHNWQSVQWRVGRDLLASNVAPADITGSYEWNRWHLWGEGITQARAHGWPIDFEVYHRLMSAKYVISFSDRPDYIVGLKDDDATLNEYRPCAQFAYDVPLQAAQGHIFVLTKEQCPPAFSASLR